MNTTISGLSLLLACLSMDPAAQVRGEQLDRGLVAIRQRDGNIWLSWRMFDADPPDVAFHLFRRSALGGITQITKQPIADVTWYVDRDPGEKEQAYFVVPAIPGKEPTNPPERVLEWIQPQTEFLTIELETPTGYTPNDGSVADLWGNGVMGLILHQAARGARQFPSG